MPRSSLEATVKTAQRNPTSAHATPSPRALGIQSVLRRVDIESAPAASHGNGATAADHRPMRRHLLDVGAERVAARAYDLLALGCCAKVPLTMPAWAPRRRARCAATPTYFPGLTINRRLVVLPLCGLHDSVLARSGTPEELAVTWAP
ncbi:MAG: hypothetical protein QOH77_1010 [Actinomycetota bacterium]|nr:hypothetical protein [Actinomycetota bacterium]